MNRSNPIVDFAAKGYESRGKRIFAPKVGEAPSLVAGSSRNLLSPSALEELFLYQRTANGAGGTGAAIFQSIKGNSIVWNQLVQNGNFATTDGWTARGATISVSNGVLTMVADNDASGDKGAYTPIDTVAGHKILLLYEVTAVTVPEGQSMRAGLFRGNESNPISASGTAQVISATGMRADVVTVPALDTYTGYYFGVGKAYSDSSISIKNLRIIDLTKYGNESLTGADFTKFYNLPYYAPNPGAIRNNCATGMVTEGLNQWDEVWERGGYNATGEKEVGNGLRCKNLIPILPNTAYYIWCARVTNQGRVCFYDADENFIFTETGVAKNAYTSPANARYMSFSFGPYTADYANDICINLSGSRNGQYEPHWSDTTALPITTATGKLNGEGASVVITPNGFAGVGTSFDEGIVEKGMWTKTAKRRMRVDLGTLTYTKDDSHNQFYARIEGLAIGTIGAQSSLICAKFVAGEVSNYSTNKKTGIIYQSGVAGDNIVYIGGSDLAADADAFKTLMSGVMLDYPLATEQLYFLDTPVPVVARVDENGTQTILPQGVDESGVPMTAPFKASIQYPMVLGKEFIGADSLKNLLDAAVEGGAITAYTMAYDEATGAYAFTINQAAATLAGTRFNRIRRAEP